MEFHFNCRSRNARLRVAEAVFDDLHVQQMTQKGAYLKINGYIARDKNSESTNEMWREVHLDPDEPGDWEIEPHGVQGFW